MMDRQDEGFNLSTWALNHKSLMVFFMLLISLAGIFSYFQLGRAEDPGFVIRTMVVLTQWPGASAKQVEEQVTDKIEKKLQELPGLDYVRSYSQAGRSTVFINLRDEVKSKEVWPSWVKARNLINDIRMTLPEGVVGPFFNDTFGDVFGSVYALTGEGFSMARMERQADLIRLQLLNVPSVSKVDLVGVQPEKIYVEIENSKLANLGIDPLLVIGTLQRQNAMRAAGRIETRTDNVYLRVTGIFESVESIRNIAIQSGGRIFRLGDIASVTRGYPDPLRPKMYFNGKEALGIAVAMEDGGNILELGESLKTAVERINREMPAGMQLNQVSDQPAVVEESIGEFVHSLIEAVIIVLAVSFISLGRQAGVVVLVSIPMVLCSVFLAMKMMGIGLHKISLGALIIALGLLVDDAIIAVEMMELKLEEGWEKARAASFAFTATAFPMLTGTLVTAAGFMPVGFSSGSASEYCGSMFWVVTIALVISWIVAVSVIPLVGTWLLKARPHLARTEGEAAEPESRFTQKFRQVLNLALHHRWIVIGGTLGLFVLSILASPLVPKEFFPPSTRPELIVEMTLPAGASFQATDREAKKLSGLLGNEPGVINHVSYIAQSSPRFVLVMDSSMAADNFAQLVVLTKGAKERDQLAEKINKEWVNQFPNVRLHSRVIANGPPSPYPVMFRIVGEKHDEVIRLADQVRRTMLQHPAIFDVVFDWYEKSLAVQLEIDQDKARSLGLDSQTLANSLQVSLSGAAVSEFREGTKTIDIVVRNDTRNWKQLDSLRNLHISTGTGQYVPLEQVARIRYQMENDIIWRRDVLPTITVMADIHPGYLGNDVAYAVSKQLEPLRRQLPPGYRIAVDGAAESSEKSSSELMSVFPVLIIVIMTLLMFQLQSISRLILVLLTAPLGLIGVNLFLLLFRQPMGFVSQLGIIALSGMIIRNSVILIDQIEKHIAQGENPWTAIVDSAILRFRPIMLTAAAAILAMIPLVRSAFWGAMAVAIMGGLLVATALTLIYLPAAYAAWFKVRLPEQD